MKKGAPSFTGKIGDIDWRIVAQFEQRLARTFGQGSIWLCGDSARTTGPIGDQSINAGFAEALDLVSRIFQVRTGEAPDLLNQYGQEYLAEWKQFFEKEKLVDCGGQVNPQVNPWISANREHWVSNLPASGEELAQLLAQLGLRLILPTKKCVKQPEHSNERKTVYAQIYPMTCKTPFIAVPRFA